jgi:hypothetical protein
MPWHIHQQCLLAFRGALLVANNVESCGRLRRYPGHARPDEPVRTGHGMALLAKLAKNYIQINLDPTFPLSTYYSFF